MPDQGIRDPISKVNSREYQKRVQNIIQDDQILLKTSLMPHSFGKKPFVSVATEDKNIITDADCARLKILFWETNGADKHNLEVTKVIQTGIQAEEIN